MVARLRDEAEPIVLRFGGGNHSRALEDEIDPRECTAGQNFKLDLENNDFRPRNGYELIGTTANTSEIRGFVTHQDVDGNASLLVQSGDTVYEWNGAAFSSVGNVSAKARLRGRLEHAWPLDEKVLITDLELQQPVMEWDGTTFKAVPQNLSVPFFAKYCFVSDERAFFGNVKANTATPHLLVGSSRSDFTTISISDRPSSALSDGDPFFLLTPDLGPINGMIEAFQVVTISSKNGQLFKLTGSSAKDFAFGELYPRSAATGEESLIYVGNDAVYGRASRLESLSSTDRFGDVQSDDISNPIQDQLSASTWKMAYNSRVQKIYFFPDNAGECWVFHKDLGPGDLSPWSRWITTHSLDFKPTTVMNCIDPGDGLEYTFMGDLNGNVYRLEGSLFEDPGSTSILTSRTSALFEGPLDTEVFDVEGWVKYRAEDEITLTITLLWAGNQVSDSSISVTLPQVSGRPVYGGPIYYGGSVYYGTPFKGRLRRKSKIPFVGQSNGFQVKAEVSANTDFEITEIGFRLEASS